MALLEIAALGARLGAIEVLRGLSCSLEPGEALLVLGSNGAGKTSMLRALSGLIATSGRIDLSGRRIDGLRPEDRVLAGLMHIPDTRGLFLPLSVEDNLRLGAHTRRDRVGLAEDLDRVWQRFPGLHRRRDQQAGTLSGGEQQMLAIGRALMARPTVLMIDEPSAGLAPRMIAAIEDALAAIRAELRVALLIAEQDLARASGLAPRHVMVLDTGRMAFLGSPDDPQLDRAIVQGYLGASVNAVEQRSAGQGATASRCGQRLGDVIEPVVPGGGQK
jgi:branched-chain amino acid transport system ATP-binding protein